MELFDAILSRRTIKDFKPDPVPAPSLERALEAGLWAQNHWLTQPWRFTIAGPETQRLLGEIFAEAQAGGEAKARADALRKIASKPRIVAVSCLVSPEESQRWEDQAAVACAVQNIQLAAWAEGLGMQWSSGRVIRLRKTYALLQIDPDVEEIIGLLFFGYPAKVPAPAPRKPLSEVTRHLP